MNKQQLYQLIREEIKNQKPNQTKTPSNVSSISKDLDDQKSNFASIKSVNSFVLLIDDLFKKLNPNFKESPQFKQGIKVIYNKYYQEKK